MGRSFFTQLCPMYLSKARHPVVRQGACLPAAAAWLLCPLPGSSQTEKEGLPRTAFHFQRELGSFSHSTNILLPSKPDLCSCLQGPVPWKEAHGVEQSLNWVTSLFLL